MTTPRVLDRDHAEIRVGGRVQRVLPNGGLGGLAGVVTWARRQVDVTFVSSVRTATFATERMGILGRTRCCPDLLLLPDNEKEETR